jgi:hypothetical protein
MVCIFHKIHHRHKSKDDTITLFASWHHRCWRVLSLLAATTTTLCILEAATTTTMAHILTAVAGE